MSQKYHKDNIETGDMESMMKLKDILTLDDLLEQAAVQRDKKARPGLDGMAGKDSLLWMQINGKRLLEEILSCRYEPVPAMSYTIAKQFGSYRRISVLSVIDRIVQACVLKSLNDECEQFFSDSSFAYRPGKGVGAALQAYCTLAGKYSYAANIDPVACFDNIEHALLIEKIQQFLSPDKALMNLISKYLELPIVIDGQLEPRTRGLLQGAPLSPLLCNLFFHSMDLWLINNSIPFMRYADDIAIFADSMSELLKYSEEVGGYIKTELRLTLNTKKMKTGKSVEDVSFLGHSFTREKNGIIALSKAVSAESSYYIWHQHKLNRTHGRIDIMSEGILRQKDFSLLFETAEESNSLPISSIDMINIYSSVILDSGLLNKALKAGILINVFDNYGKLVGRFSPNSSLKAPVATHEQLQAYYDERHRLSLAREFVLSSIHNLRIVIRYYNKQDPKDHYIEALEEIKKRETEIRRCTSYDQLLMTEAAVRKLYYGCYDWFIKAEGFSFGRRSRRPPKNPVNAMLSFGNTVLYNIIACKINKSALDIRVGFLHAAKSRRMESLNLDIAEVFKPLLVDRVVFSQINLKVIREEHFSHEENGGVYLNENGKRLFLKAFYEKLEDGLKIKDKYYTYEMLVDEEVRKLVRHFRSHEAYRAYRQVR